MPLRKTEISAGSRRHVGLELLLAPLGVVPPEGVDGTGDGGREQGRRVRLAHERLEDRHAGFRDLGLAGHLAVQVTRGGWVELRMNGFAKRLHGCPGLCRSNGRP